MIHCDIGFIGNKGVYKQADDTLKPRGPWRPLTDTFLSIQT